MKHSGGAGINDKVWYIERYMRKEAKYKLKRPVRLTKEGMDLRVIICHIREDRFKTGAHILSISDDNSRLTVTIVKTRIELACPCDAFTAF
jgi:hypothetical protein